MFQVAYKTDVGIKRASNQDTIKYSDKLKCFIVADGMGGHLAGEIASQLAVKTIVDYLQTHLESENAEGCLRSAISHANKSIYLKALDNVDYRGMGTTCSMVVLKDKQIHIAHVGDSRIYFINEGGIEQVTTDHSLVESLVESGEITRDEARHHPKRHVITRAIGTDPTVEVDYAKFDADTILKIVICSDGLTEKVEDLEILKTINAHTIDESVNVLVELANDRGGSDNISVVLISLVNEY